MARARWADAVDSNVEDSPALIQSNQFTGNVIDSEMSNGLPLQDMKRCTDEETLDPAELDKNGQNCVAFQPEVNWQPVIPMPCMAIAQDMKQWWLCLPLSSNITPWKAGADTPDTLRCDRPLERPSEHVGTAPSNISTAADSDLTFSDPRNSSSPGEAGNDPSMRRLVEIYPISKPWTTTPTDWKRSKLPSTVVLQQAKIDQRERVRDIVSTCLEDRDQGGHEWIRRQALEIWSHPNVGTATFWVQEMIKAKDQKSKIGDAIMLIWKHIRQQKIVVDSMNITQIMPEVIFLIDFHFQVADAPSRVSGCYKRDTMLELILVAILHFGAEPKAGYRIEGINEETLVRMILPPSCRIFCKDNLADIEIETLPPIQFPILSTASEYVECRGKLKDWKKAVRRLLYEKLPVVTEEDLVGLAKDLEAGYKLMFIQGPAKRTEWDGKAVLLYATSHDKMYWLGRLPHSGVIVHLRRDLLRQPKSPDDPDGFRRRRKYYILQDAHDKPKELEDRVLIPYEHKQNGTCNEIMEALRKDESLEVVDLFKDTEKDVKDVLFLTPVGLSDARRKVLLLPSSQVCHARSSSVGDVAKAAWERRDQDCRKRGEKPAGWQKHWQVTKKMKERWLQLRETELWTDWSKVSGTTCSAFVAGDGEDPEL